MTSDGKDYSREDETRPIEEVLREDKLRHLFSEASTQEVATVDSGAPLRQALELLQRDASRGAVLVVKPSGGEKEVVGIFTERDYLDKCAGVSTDLSRPVDELMTASPQAVSPDDTVDAAIRLMTGGGYRHLPVTDGGKLVGLVSTQDIILYLAEFFPMEVYNLPPRLHQDQRIDTREGG